MIEWFDKEVVYDSRYGISVNACGQMRLTSIHKDNAGKKYIYNEWPVKA